MMRGLKTVRSHLIQQKDYIVFAVFDQAYFDLGEG